MSFEKRVCVLKQVRKGFTADGSALSGAIYAERMGQELTVKPRLLGVAPLKEGRYALALWIDGNTFIAELKGSAPIVMEAPSIKGGFAALVVFIRGEVQPVAFGSCGIAPTGYEALLAAFADGEKHAPPVQEEKEESSTKSALPMAGEAPSFRERAAAKYDDEAIADADYYSGTENGDGQIGFEGEGAKKAQEGGAGPEKDEGAIHPFLRTGGSLAYYHSVRGRLEEAFRRLPKDERLLTAFPCSEWVSLEGALLGIIYENGTPKFLCVAVEANGDPPAEIREHACFVPATPFSDTVGFFVVFQSADSGEYVTVSSS